MKSNKSNQMKQFVGSQIDRARCEVRNNWREMVAAEEPAGTMAKAFAGGTLVSTIPVPLVDMALAAYITRRFTQMPRAPFFAGMAVANNLVMAPLYASTPKVGGVALNWLAGHASVNAPEALLVRILVGYLLIALGMALASFVLAGTGFRGYQMARRPQPVMAADLETEFFLENSVSSGRHSPERWGKHGVQIVSSKW